VKFERGTRLAGETQKLKVFISWAGDRANAIGSGFHEFLPDVVNAIQPFMSGTNIDKGTRWGEVLNGSLQESSCAIVCLTRESMNSVWVAFEAGAISRAAGGTDGARSRIWTYLSGLEAKDLHLTPFAEYQATSATQEETFRLVRSINQLSPDPVSAESLKRRFDAVFWPNFSKELDRVRDMPDTPGGPTPVSGPENEMLSEILTTLRSVQRDVSRSGARADAFSEILKMARSARRDDPLSAYLHNFCRATTAAELMNPSPYWAEKTMQSMLDARGGGANPDGLAEGEEVPMGTPETG